MIEYLCDWLPLQPAKQVYQLSRVSIFLHFKKPNENRFTNLHRLLRTTSWSIYHCHKFKCPLWGYKKAIASTKKKRSRRRSSSNRTLPFATCITKKFSFPSAPAGHYFFGSPRHDLGALVACQAIAMNVSHWVCECVGVCVSVSIWLCVCPSWISLFSFHFFFFLGLFFNAFCCSCHKLKLKLVANFGRCNWEKLMIGEIT